MYDSDNVSVIQRSRAERKKLGIKRVNTPSKLVPPVASEPEPKEDIVEEILQGVSKVESDITEESAAVCPSGDLGVEGEPGEKEGAQKDEVAESETPELDKYVASFTGSTKKKSTKKKVVKKSGKKKKKTTSRGKNVKVDDLNQEELSDLFSSPTATVDDDDDDE